FLQVVECGQVRRQVVCGTGEDDVLDGRVGPYGGQCRIERFQRDDDTCASVAELMFKLGRGVERVGRDSDATSLEHAKEGDRILRHVRQAERDAVTTLKT